MFVQKFWIAQGAKDDTPQPPPFSQPSVHRQRKQSAPAPTSPFLPVIASIAYSRPEHQTLLGSPPKVFFFTKLISCTMRTVFRDWWPALSFGFLFRARTNSIGFFPARQIPFCRVPRAALVLCLFGDVQVFFFWDVKKKARGLSVSRLTFFDTVSYGGLSWSRPDGTKSAFVVPITRLRR